MDFSALNNREYEAEFHNVQHVPAVAALSLFQQRTSQVYIVLDSDDVLHAAKESNENVKNMLKIASNEKNNGLIEDFELVKFYNEFI